jgi:hypothetical protein
VRTALIVLVLILVVVAGYVLFSTPLRSEPVGFGSDPDHLRLIRRAPADAPAVFLVPRAAGFFRMMRGHPIASSWVPIIERRQELALLPYLLGRADVVAWQQEQGVAIVANPDPVRLALTRAYLAMKGERRIVVGDGLLFVGTPPVSETGAEIASNANLRGQAFAIHREGSEDDFPPIGRPAVSAVILEPDGLKVESEATASGPLAAGGVPLDSYPEGAMLSTVAATTPEWVERLGRLIPPVVVSLLREGALFAVYRISGEDLIPRLHLVIAVPGGNSKDVDDVVGKINLGPFGLSESRRMVGGVEVVRRTGMGSMIEYATSSDKLLISFDRSSIERYLADRMVKSPFPPERTVWFATMKPAELAEGIDELRDRQELSLLAPDLHDAIRQAGAWLRYVRGARLVQLARVTENGREHFILNVSK